MAYIFVYDSFNYRSYDLMSNQWHDTLSNEVSKVVNEAMKGALVRLDSQTRKELATIDRIILP